MTLPPNVKAALETDLILIRGLEGISYKHKGYIVANTIKKYQAAFQSNELCPACKVRPIFTDKCRQCLGMSVLSWAKHD